MSVKVANLSASAGFAVFKDNEGVIVNQAAYASNWHQKFSSRQINLRVRRPLEMGCEGTTNTVTYCHDFTPHSSSSRTASTS
mmetsp:Transcript_26709/g.48111  ORF Transcript_26709/g.48111 Transcript_26709/m.48111 type:complete len:82 (+) Transcript_26709:205-450(+)